MDKSIACSFTTIHFIGYYPDLIFDNSVESLGNLLFRLYLYHTMQMAGSQEKIRNKEIKLD